MSGFSIIGKLDNRLEYQCLASNWKDAVNKFVHERSNAGVMDDFQTWKECGPGLADYLVHDTRKNRAIGYFRLT